MAGILVNTESESLEHALGGLDGVAELRAALAGHEVWLVGGAVRDLLRGEERADLDIVVTEDAAELASRLGEPESAQETFNTATVRLRDVQVDVAGARRETYAHPGALPEVEPASLSEDLARRDFTVNAMAIPLHGPAELIDPSRGLTDLDAGLLRVLHPNSFRDDPTRALRAARYAARLDMGVEAVTLALLEATDLRLVSADRVRAEIRRIVAEEAAPDALMLLAGWGLAGIDAAAPVRLRATRELLADPDWAEVADLGESSLAAAIPPPASAAIVETLTFATPDRPSAGVTLLAGAEPTELVAARIAGAEWLDGWARAWRKVSLEISGTDLMDAGVPQGPAVGAGLQAAFRSKLDGEAAGHEDELRIALAAAT